MPNRCNACQNPFKDGAKFCQACGAKVDLKSIAEKAEAPAVASQSPPISAACLDCSGDNSLGAKFCRHCGALMDGSVLDLSANAPKSESVFARSEGEDDWGDKLTPLWKRRWFIPALLTFVAVIGAGSWYTLLRPADSPCIGSNSSTRPECAQALESSVTGTEQDMYIVADANIRDSATAQGSNIVTKLLRGIKVNGVMQIGADGESKWFKLGDGRGYIGAINLSAVEPPKLATILNEREWFLPSELMLRASPSDNAAILETIAAGTKVALAGLTENNFVEVKRPKGGGPLERFVLKPFTSKEDVQLKEVKERAYGALKETLTHGLEIAMNKYN